MLTDTPLPLARLAMLDEAFAESDLPFRVDIVDWARTSEEFRTILRRSHAVLVERSRVRSAPAAR